MEVNTDTVKNKKKSFQLNRQKDTGNLLTVHHTITNTAGEFVRIKFVHIFISDSNEVIACVDHRGNIFCFNLLIKKYWVIQNKFKSKCTIGKFLPCRNGQILFGTKAGELLRIDLNVGVTIFESKPHNTPIINFEFSTSVLPSKPSPTGPSLSNSTNLFLSITRTESKLFDLDTFVLRHTLEYDENTLTIIDIKFIQNTDKIFSCFSDDTIHIWNKDNMELVMKFSPFKNLDKFKKKMIETLELEESGSQYNPIPSINLKGYSKYDGRIFKASLIDCDRSICLFTIDNIILILNITTGDVTKVIKITDFPLKDIHILTYIENLDVCNTYAFIRSETDNIFLVNLNNLCMKLKINNLNLYKIYSNQNNGKIFGFILKTGEIMVQNFDYYLGRLESHQRNLDYLSDNGDNVFLERVYQEIKTTLSKECLDKILKEYGIFPTKYRSIIWRSLLSLPQNYEIFTEMIKKGDHPCVCDYEKMYPLRDITALRNLKTIVSCLSYWTVLFSQVDYISQFVFPFLKVFSNDLLSCFEAIATILLNQCQLWFEFYPLEPLNYLGIIENILTYFDQDLIKFYKKHKITSKVYGFQLMKNGLSEVLDENEWYQLWDNILFNEADFLLFAIVAYNFVQKHVIINLKNDLAIENYFHEQNPIVMQKFIRTIYELKDRCPNDIHPKKYFKSFEILTKHNYQKFENYPKKLVSMKTDTAEIMKMENIVLEEKMHQMESMEKVLQEQLKEKVLKEEHEKRMKEVQTLYDEALFHEEDRIAHQRKLLLSYQKQIREREMQILNETRNSVLRRSVLAKENELNHLLKNLERKKIRDCEDILAAEENYKDKEIEALCKKYNTENEFLINEENQLSNKFENSRKHLERQHSEMRSELSQINGDYSVSHVLDKNKLISHRGSR